MISSSPNTLWRYGFFNLAILVLISAWFWQQNTPVSLAEPQLPADGKLQCVSYAPYYGEGQTPFIVGTRISQFQIESDLKLLAVLANSPANSEIDSTATTFFITLFCPD